MMKRKNRHNKNHRENNFIDPHNEMPSLYNFIPISKEVVFVDEWADKISHDIPFSDGISGTISVKIITESPIYIRNGGNWKDEERLKRDSKMQFFSQTEDKRHFIPATSFKGMLRNVLEIATFSKMQFVDDKRYSIRDLHYKIYTNKMTKEDNGVVYPQAKSGWLKKINGLWVIIPCDFARVEINDLERYYPNGIDLHSKQSSASKYRRWGTNLNINFDLDTQTIHNHDFRDRRGNHPLKLFYKKARNLGRGAIRGKLVFTGQPTPYNGQRRRKHMEFIFYNEDIKNQKKIDPKLMEDFEFIHSDEKGNPNEEWNYLKNKDEIPVFYLEENGKIESFGLAMMYRLPYKYSIGELIKNNFCEHFKKESIDFTEAIFGYTEKEKPPLKGRVHISHFFETTNYKEKDDLPYTVLGSPKPTYYPNYIDQTNTQIVNRHRDYKTYMDKDAIIRGWKRYPLKKEETDLNELPSIPTDRNGRENLDVATLFYPLLKGTVFEGKIRVHNLKPEELGALMWSLTFEEPEKYKHIIGMAKAYGLGIIKVEIKDEETFLIDNQNNEIDYKKSIQKFINFMNNKITSCNWKRTKQIKTLLAMSNKNIDTFYEKRYPSLDPQNNDRRMKNEFVYFKNENKYLKDYLKAKEKNLPQQQTQQIYHSQNRNNETNIFSNLDNEQGEIQEKDSKINIEEILEKLKSSKVKDVRKILKSLLNYDILTLEFLSRIEAALKKRSDYLNQKFAQEEKNYLSLLDILKEKLKNSEIKET